MPNKRSAAKRVLIGEKNRLYNRFWKSRCKNAGKRFLSAIEQKDKELAVKCMNEAQSMLDKAVVKGVIHRNTAARRKSSMANKIASL